MPNFIGLSLGALLYIDNIKIYFHCQNTSTTFARNLGDLVRSTSSQERDKSPCLRAGTNSIGRGRVPRLRPRTPASPANVDCNRALATTLRMRMAEAAAGGSASARDRHVKRGKLLPRDRINRLLDL